MKSEQQQVSLISKNDDRLATLQAECASMQGKVLQFSEKLKQDVDKEKNLHLQRVQQEKGIEFYIRHG